MNLQTKALYNLLKLTCFHNSSIDVEPWQVEDLRKVSIDKLFKRTKSFRIVLDKNKFLLYVDNCDTPEELLDVLASDQKKESKDQIYLLLFELWRKLTPEKQSLSLFFDELDHRIFLYDNHHLENDEFIQDALANLKRILDKNTDVGVDPKKAFLSLMSFSAHNLENFIYDYISDQIDCENDLYATELLDGFYPYLSKTLWFDFLKAQILADENISESNEIIRKILKRLEQEPNLDLQFRILQFMVEVGDRELFLKIVKRTLLLLKEERDFKNVMQLVGDYYLRLDNEKMEKAIADTMNKRSKIDLNQKIKKEDIANFLNIIS